MAKLIALPDLAIVAGFKGTLDFATMHMAGGPPIPYCRKWPKRKTAPPLPDEQAWQQVFAYVTALYPTMSESVQAAARAQAAGTSLTGRDVITRAYLKGDNI